MQNYHRDFFLSIFFYLVNFLPFLKENTFFGLTSLQSLDFSDFDALSDIESGAFNGLTQLTDLDLSGKLLTSLKENTFFWIIIT